MQFDGSDAGSFSASYSVPNKNSLTNVANYLCIFLLLEFFESSLLSHIHCRWFDIERILTEKRSLSDSKIICPFGWNHLFAIILQNGEPPKEVSFFTLDGFSFFS